MKDKSLGDFLRELASAAPTPGGGTVAALAGAMAAALVGMVGGLAARRGEEAAEVISRAEKLREGLLQLADRDSAAYDRVDKALKLPKGGEEEREARRRALQTALKEAARVPLETAEWALEVLRLARDSLSHCPKSARSDLASACALAQAAVNAALYNVDANCLAIKDPEFLTQVSARRKALAREGERLAEEIKRVLEPSLFSWLGERDSNPH